MYCSSYVRISSILAASPDGLALSIAYAMPKPIARGRTRMMRTMTEALLLAELFSAGVISGRPRDMSSDGLGLNPPESMSRACFRGGREGGERLTSMRGHDGRGCRGGEELCGHGLRWHSCWGTRSGPSVCLELHVHAALHLFTFTD